MLVVQRRGEPWESRVDADWIILADHVEVVNNKLYLMGDGWDALTVNALPAQHQLAVAVAFSVPWNETSQRHDIEIEVADEDERPLLTIGGQVELGRPPGIPLGQAQRVQMGVNLGLTFDHLGTYVVTARIEGQHAKRIRFHVLAGPGLAAHQWAQPPRDAPS